MRRKNIQNNVENKIRSILLDDGYFLFRIKKKSTSSTWSYFDIMNTKGITLIALIITIILMLILTGVVVSLTLGENGIFGVAKEAKKQTTIAEYKEKVELSRAQVATYNLGEVTLDNLIEQIYKDKIVQNGNITKSADGQSAKMMTKEEYMFLITTDTVEYIGTGNIKPTVKEAKLDIVEIKEGKATIKIKAATPDEYIQKIELYNKENEIIKTMNYSIELEQIETQPSLYLPFYEEQSYYAKIISSESEMTTNTVTPAKNINYIATAKDLKKLSDLVEAGEKFTGQTIKQVENIDLSSICSATLGTWHPIGHVGGNTCWFNGNYDGNNKEVMELYINNTADITVGLFGFLGYNGKIDNLTVGGKVTSNSNRYTGGIVGRNEGTIENCVNNVEVSGTNNAGGVAGGNVNALINCVNNANINAPYSYAGGIVSANENYLASIDTNITTQIIVGCINSEKAIIIGNSQVGGICGYQDLGTIENCINEGTVIAKTNIAGGIVGNSKNDIKNCKNKGAVTSQGNPSNQEETQGTGGIVGRTIANISCSSNEGDISSEGYFVGGIVGCGSANTVISKCYNKGSVRIEKNAAGGIVGVSAKEISDCYNYLSSDKLIKANYNVGGIIGNESRVTDALIKNCYSIGDIIGTSNAAILGAWFTTGIQINNCYYLNSSTLNGTGDNYEGTLTSNNIVKKDLSEFKLEGSNTDSVTYLLNENGSKEIWKQNKDINDGLPYLKENIPE